MLVRATRQGDVEVAGAVQALFPGQLYDLPDEIVRSCDWLEAVSKAVSEPPQDKAVAGPARTKGVRRGNP